MGVNIMLARMERVIIVGVVGMTVEAETGAVRTFFPGLPSTVPSAFSTVPLILLSTFSLTALSFFVGAFFLVTRPVVVLSERGLEVLAFVVAAFLAFFFSFLLTSAAVVGTSGKVRGLLLPVCWRVARMGRPVEESSSGAMAI